MRAFIVYFYKPFCLHLYSAIVFFFLSLASSTFVIAQEKTQSAAPSPRPLIVDSVDESRLTVLNGNTHPLARPQFDLGTAPATLPMERMLLVLKRSADQEAALRKMLDDQQDKHSPSYHKWLTPEQYGQQFGPTDADLQAITGWLQSHGFQVGSTKGRTVLEFSGSSSQVQEAFHTTIHKYIVNGEQHWANANDPSIPTALTPAVAGVASLNNFPKKAMNRFVGKYSERTKQVVGAEPEYTYACGNGVECYAVVPYDFATIYNVLPLWSVGINGSGQTIAIVGRTNINPSDAMTFWSLFGLTVPSNKLQVTLNGSDPGINGDEPEADIDVQWSGAVAPQATINFVTSQSTETTDGVDLSAVYIVENNLAPVMSESYGECEMGLGTAGNQFVSALWEQAAAQGITVMVASGDNGAAGCDDPSTPAQNGLAVSGNTSTPFNVSVGGTDFNQYKLWSTYWSATNNPTSQQSAKGYIPETTWNNSCTNALAITLGYGTTAEQACNNPSMIASGGVISAGGSGGASNCTVSSQTLGSCTQGYSKPSWQTGAGVPADGKRDLPDVSLFASNGFLGSFYLICQSDLTGGVCDLNNLPGYGGTSVSSPAFAGIMALVNQQTGSRQGNANYVLYKLAAQQPTAFHDVTNGTIAMPCVTGSPNCTTSTAGDAYGVLTGYNAGANYDLATGLGSVNANVLVTKWDSVTLLASATTLNSLTPTTLTHGQAANFNVTVKPQSGSGTPTGLVTLMGGTGSTPQSVGGFSLTSGSVAGSTEMLPGGTYSVTAHYPGDSTYSASDSNPVAVTVNPESSQPQVFLVTFDSNGNVINSDTNTAVYGSPYVLRVNVENSAGKMCAPTAASGATACPTGTVTLTDNGSPLDAGTYTLNSYAYFEDTTVQLPGGTTSVGANYGGDASFAASAVATPITLTPAPTTASTPNVQYWGVGSDFVASVTYQAQSSGVAPTGTVTFFVNGSPVTGTVSYQATAGSASSPTASLGATFTSLTNVFPTAGTYAISSTYSGDSNYAGSTSAAYSVKVQFPSPLLSMTPSAVTVAAGGSVTISAIVDTRLPNVPVPTGPVPFINWGPMTPVTGTETYSTIADSSGNVALQASLTFVPASSMNVGASYAGDANYPSAAGGGLIYVTVTGSDFILLPIQDSVTLSPGQQNGFSIYVQGQSTYNGTINFSSTSCSGLPQESSCVFNPASITGSGSTNLSVTTTAPHPAAALRSSSAGGMFTMSVALVGILLFPLRRSGKRLLPLIAMTALLVIVPSCGGGGGGSGSSGGGGGGGTTDPGTPAGTYIVKVTATSGSLSHSFTFTLTVQ